MSEARVRVLGIDIDSVRTEELMRRIRDMTAGPTSRLICYVNAETCNQALFDRRYQAILHEADLVYADGMGVVWASQLTGHPLPERITLGDVLPEVCRLAVERQLKLFFLGGAPGVAQRAAQRLSAQFPGLSIVGASHGYFSEQESTGMIETINRARPHLPLVGMGVPRQEKWLWQPREC